MARKKTRFTDGDRMLTLIFLGMLALAACAGLFAQVSHHAPMP